MQKVPAADLRGGLQSGAPVNKRYLLIHAQKKKREDDAAAAVEEVDAEAETEAEAPPKKKKVHSTKITHHCGVFVCAATVDGCICH